MLRGIVVSGFITTERKLLMSISDHFLNKRRRKGPNLLFLKPWKAGVFLRKDNKNDVF